MKQATKILTFAMLACATAFCAHGDITTGWLPTAAGTYTFTDSANWANGDVNGVFSADWVSAGKQTLQFANDWTGTINVYGGVNNEITLAGRNGIKTLNIIDDFDFMASSMTSSSSQFIFANTLVLDLGGATRKLHLNGTAGWMFQGTVQNGTLDINGTGQINLRDSNAQVTSDVKLSGGVNYKTTYTSGTSSDVDKVRAANMSISRSSLHFAEARHNVDDKITGELRILGDEPSCSFLRLTVGTSGKYEALTIGSLTVDDGGLLTIRGSGKLGANEPRTADTASVKFETLPTCVNGIMPRVVGTIEANESDSLTLDPYKATFVAYDASCGVKPLAASDYAADISGADPSVDNIKVVAGGTLAISENTTVNSLLLDSTAYNVAPGTVGGSGVLTVASGMVMAKPWKDSGKGDPQINVPLNFADRKGYLINAGTINGTGYRVRLGKPISGTAGLVLQHLAPVAQTFKINGLSSFAAEGTSGDSTYTGDTYVQSAFQLNGNAFLPSGARFGNVYVNGALESSSVATEYNITINGLYGCGLVYGRGDTLIVGDNNCDGDFSGNVSISGNTTVLANLNKIGAGTQRLAGSVMLGTALNVNAGKVVLDGTVTQGAVNVAAGAAIGGNGSIATTLTFADGAKFDVDVANDVAICLNVTGAVTGGPVTINANVTSGKWRTAQCVLRSNVAITATFNRGAGVGALELRNNGTELWASPKVSGFTIIIR